MIFLIEYDRELSRIIKMSRYPDRDRERAEDERLALELELRRAGQEHEVVLLEAKDEKALRRTHGRYFENLTEILQRFLDNGR